MVNYYLAIAMAITSLSAHAENDMEFTLQFNKAFEHTMGHEGKFQRNEKDRGNWTSGKIGVGELKGTKWGISAAKYPMVNIMALKRHDAKKIYYRDYWQPYNYGQLQVINLSNKVFSNTVVMGPSSSHKILQRALRACGTYTPADGLIGPDTWFKANEYGVSDCYETLDAAFNSETAAHFRMVAIAKPVTKVFLAGWLNRAYEDDKGIK